MCISLKSLIVPTNGVVLYDVDFRVLLAEREGFEPPVALVLQRISNPPHSSTLPPLQ